MTGSHCPGGRDPDASRKTTSFASLAGSNPRADHVGDRSQVAVHETEQTRATYQSLVNTLPLAVLIKDRDGSRLFANHAYLQFRGLTADEVLGKRDEDLFPPEIASQYREDDRRVIENGEVLRDIEESLDRSGNRCWVERIKSPVVDQNDQVIGVQLVFWEVTTRVLAERELKHERELLRNLLQHIPDCIYFKDRQSRFLRISEAMAKKFGLSSADAARGKTDADIFSSEHADAAREDELHVMQTGKPLVDRIEKETWRDREDTWCLTTKMPFVSEEGDIIGTFGISRDITELKKSQDELREARDTADRANRAKSDFLANMSHEIRTPLNAVIGMSELLAQTTLSEEQRDYVELVRDSADALLGLLNDILDFSKIEARKLELERIPFSIRDMIEKTARSLAVRASEKGLELACRVAPDVPDRLIGDPGRLRQVMLNLIGNAVKFTDEGEVVVEVSVTAPAPVTSHQTAVSDEPRDRTCTLKFSVQDTGIGIPEEKQATVLEAFTQADSSTTRRFGGTGLGLAISRELVDLMHGQLTLQSDPGVGTAFSFEIELPVAPSSDSSSTQLEKLDHLRVLVVDDNATNLRILREILNRWHFEPTLARSGAEALELVEQANRQGNPFPLGILDCMMPEMDGFELAGRIRESCTIEQTKLVILSSASIGDDLSRCETLGVSRYLTKPIVQSELLETVLQLMGVRPQQEDQPPEAIPQCPPLRVLVAEDGVANQHVLVGMLRAAGHKPAVASDGRETLLQWRNHPFDLILMDMHMPLMDGIEATRQIRHDEALTGKHIPIIAVTAAAMKEDARRCEEAGMDAYLTKPIQPRKLHEMLARFAAKKSGNHPRQANSQAVIENREDTHPNTPRALQDDRLNNASASQVEANPNASGEPSTVSPVASPGASKALDDTTEINLRAAMERIPGGEEGVRQLAKIFLPECDDLMKTLEEELPEGDRELIQRTAHTLKGSAHLFCAEKVVKCSLLIEHLAHGGKLTEAAEHLSSLKRDVHSMQAALKKFIDGSDE